MRPTSSLARVVIGFSVPAVILAMLVGVLSACAGTPEGPSSLDADRPGGSPVSESSPRSRVPSPPGFSQPDASASDASEAGRREAESWTVLSSAAERAALRPAELRLEGAVLDSRGNLELAIAVVNPSTDSHAFGNDLDTSALRLADAGGRHYLPEHVDPAMARFDTDGGMAPGSRHAGRVRFPRPDGGEPWTLELPGFFPLTFRSAEVPPIVASRAGVRPASRGAQAARWGDPGTAAALEDLLQRHAAALERYDLDAYLETFVPARHNAERQVLTRLRLVPLFDVEARLAESPRGGEDGSLEAPVTVRFHLDGLPKENPFVYVPRYTFVETGTGWKIAEITPTEDREVAFWRRGELTTHRTNHFHLYAPPRAASHLVEMAEEAEAAYATLYQRGLPLSSGYLVHLVADPRRFARLAGRPDALGVALARYDFQAGETFVDSQAFYLNGSILAAEGGAARWAAEQRALTVTHELVHLALASATRPFTPGWLKEGMAVYFSSAPSYDENRALVQAGLGNLDLVDMSRRGALGEHDPTGRSAAAEYLFSGNVVAHLVEIGGRDRLLGFYRAYAETPLESLGLASPRPGFLMRVAAGGVGAIQERLTEELLGRYYGLDLTALESEVKDRLELRYR